VRDKVFSMCEKRAYVTASNDSGLRRISCMVLHRSEVMVSVRMCCTLLFRLPTHEMCI